MKLHHSDPDSDDLPSGLVHPYPITRCQRSLFQISLAKAIARLGVSPDDLRRWHGRGWLSFDEKLNEELDEDDDPRIFEIQIVRDLVRSGLTDDQIEILFDKLPKPFAFNPDALAYSFRHGWVSVDPPVIPEPYEIIEEHIDSWINDCDQETLERLRDQISEALKLLEKVRQKNEVLPQS